MNFSRILALSAAVLFLSGCARDAHDGEGRLRISFSSDAAVNGVVVTRAAEQLAGLDGLIPVYSAFGLTITDAEGSTVGTWEDITTFPEEGIVLSPGDYTATAATADGGEGFDCPRFGASAGFTITNGGNVSIALTASLLNMAVTVEYTDEFKGYFPTHNAVIMRDEAEVVDFSEQGSSLAAFIEPQLFTLAITGTRQNGNPYSTTVELNSEAAAKIAACTYLRIILDVNGGGAGSASITVSFSGVEETIEVPALEVGEEDEETNP